MKFHSWERGRDVWLKRRIRVALGARVRSIKLKRRIRVVLFAELPDQGKVGESPNEERCHIFIRRYEPSSESTLKDTYHTRERTIYRELDNYIGTTYVRLPRLFTSQHNALQDTLSSIIKIRFRSSVA